MRTLNIILFLYLVAGSHPVSAEPAGSLTAKSPPHRVALLELYTSQGCSSCPPAEQWLSSLKQTGISSQQLIPLAFHVTYWDYIGWRDRYGSARYDQRQRSLAAFNAKKTVYTPQFVLAGSDYRTYNRFANDVSEIISQPATVDLELTVRESNEAQGDNQLLIELHALAEDDLDELALYIAVYEDGLSNEIGAGENVGELLHHDYVVQRLYGPYVKPQAHHELAVQQEMVLDNNWNQKQVNLVAFAQNARSGEILQAVSIKLDALDK